MLVALFLAAVAQSAPDSEVLIPAGSDWRFFADGSALPADWMASAFDDTGWGLGAAQLGYGQGDEATVLPFGSDPAHKPMVVRFRHAFDFEGAPGTRALRLRLVRDDGVQVFLNGEEVVRDNLPKGELAVSQPAVTTIWGADESAWHEFWISADLLRPGRNVVAVAVHQVHPASTDLSFDLELVRTTPPELLRGPYLQSGTPQSVVVRWRTPLPSSSLVRFGLAGGKWLGVARGPVSATDHEVLLDGLQPATEYRYQILAAGRVGGDKVEGEGQVIAGGAQGYTFRTAPPIGSREPFRAWILGDPGTANAVQAGVRDAYYRMAREQKRRTDLWLLLGDNAYLSGTDREYQHALYEMYPETLATSVVWSTRGNHEAIADVYYDMFTFPTAGEAGGVPSGSEAYYSFDWGNVHFICLDSMGTSKELGSPMLEWLEADLAATDQDFRVAFWHHPPYSKGSHDSDNPRDSAGRMMAMRQNVLPILEAGGVDLTFTGHSHSYERSYLIGGHYGLSSTLQPEMILDHSDGDPAGGGRTPYPRLLIPEPCTAWPEVLAKLPAAR